MTTQATSQATTLPITVTRVPTALELVPTMVVLAGLCSISAWVCHLLRLFTSRTQTRPDIEPGDAYRIGLILLSTILLMTLLPSVLVMFLDPASARSLQWIGVITRGTVLGAAVVATHHFVPGGLAKLGLSMGKFAEAWKGIGALVLAVPWIYLALVLSQFVLRATDMMPEQQTHETLTLIRENRDVVAVAMATFGAVLLAPAMEEFLFRGLLQTALARVTKRPWLAIGLTSLLFAGIHPPFSIPAIFVLSLAVGWLYHRTQNLWAAIAFHVAFNTVNTGITLMLR